ncbi:hypothetical protein ACOME3_002903 [Neoechinorhynchus agilis]
MHLRKMAKRRNRNQKSKADKQSKNKPAQSSVDLTIAKDSDLKKCYVVPLDEQFKSLQQEKKDVHPVIKTASGGHCQSDLNSIEASPLEEDTRNRTEYANSDQSNGEIESKNIVEPIQHSVVEVSLSEKLASKMDQLIESNPDNSVKLNENFKEKEIVSQEDARLASKHKETNQSNEQVESTQSLEVEENSIVEYLPIVSAGNRSSCSKDDKVLQSIPDNLSQSITSTSIKEVVTQEDVQKASQQDRTVQSIFEPERNSVVKDPLDVSETDQIELIESIVDNSVQIGEIIEEIVSRVDEQVVSHKDDVHLIVEPQQNSIIEVPIDVSETDRYESREQTPGDLAKEGETAFTEEIGSQENGKMASPQIENVISNDTVQSDKKEEHKEGLDEKGLLKVSEEQETVINKEQGFSIDINSQLSPNYQSNKSSEQTEDKNAASVDVDLSEEKSIEYRTPPLSADIQSSLEYKSQTEIISNLNEISTSYIRPKFTPSTDNFVFVIHATGQDQLFLWDLRSYHENLKFHICLNILLHDKMRRFHVPRYEIRDSRFYVVNVNGTFYRAKFNCPVAESGPMLARIVDFGGSVRIWDDFIFDCPEVVKHCPEIAFHCKLAGINFNIDDYPFAVQTLMGMAMGGVFKISCVQGDNRNQPVDLIHLWKVPGQFKVDPENFNQVDQNMFISSFAALVTKYVRFKIPVEPPVIREVTGFTCFNLLKIQPMRAIENQSISMQFEDRVITNRREQSQITRSEIFDGRIIGTDETTIVPTTLGQPMIDQSVHSLNTITKNQCSQEFVTIKPEERGDHIKENDGKLRLSNFIHNVPMQFVFFTKTSVFVVSVESPRRFYVWREDARNANSVYIEAFNRYYSDLAKRIIVNRAELKDDQIYAVDIGTLVVRAILVKGQAKAEKVSIFLLDYGQQIEVDVTSIFYCELEFQQIKPMAYPCGLEDDQIPPHSENQTAIVNFVLRGNVFECQALYLDASRWIHLVLKMWKVDNEQKVPIRRLMFLALNNPSSQSQEGSGF